jgi:hypothetical protein
MAGIPLYIERIDTFIPPDSGESFFAEIGRIVTLWGALDSALDLTLQMVNRQERGPHLYEAKTSSQKRRRDALSKWFRNDASLSHVRSDGEKIVTAASRIQAFRDVFAHGWFLEFVAGPPIRMKFSKLETNTQKKARVHTFDLLRLRRISHDLEILRFASLALSLGAVGDGSMPAPAIYALARKRFPSNLDQLHTVGWKPHSKP